MTNNDVESWHNSFNRRAHGKEQLPLYLLIELLHQEARLTSLQIRLVSERKLRQVQRKVYHNMQARIFDLWDEYDKGKKCIPIVKGMQIRKWTFSSLDMKFTGIGCLKHVQPKWRINPLIPKRPYIYTTTYLMFEMLRTNVPEYMIETAFICYCIYNCK